MYGLHPSFEAPLAETTIWRYMDFTKLVDLLARKQLFFPRPDKLGDPLEGSYTRPVVEDAARNAERGVRLTGGFTSLNPRVQVRDMAYRNLRSFVFVSCWHMNKGESAAMWKIYVDRGQGVAIRTTFAGLVSAVAGDPETTVHIGKVRYLNKDTDRNRDDDPYFDPLLWKWESYACDQELRAMGRWFLDQLPPGTTDDVAGKAPPGKYVAVDLNRLIQKIHVAPSSPQWFVELVSSVAATYGLTGDLVRRSSHDDPALY
jgi:hypothetical protein